MIIDFRVFGIMIVVVVVIVVIVWWGFRKTVMIGLWKGLLHVHGTCASRSKISNHMCVMMSRLRE